MGYLAKMHIDANDIKALAGASFIDRSGQRWWIKGLRPQSTDQFVVEAQVKASYPRVDLYVMTAPEFIACASKQGLKRCRPQAAAKR